MIDGDRLDVESGHGRGAVRACTVAACRVLAGAAAAFALWPGPAPAAAQAIGGPGPVLAWGLNTDGGLGDGSAGPSLSLPASDPASGAVTQAAAGAVHSLLLLSDGTVEAAGDNTDGELGLGTTTDASVFSRVAALGPASAVSAGDGDSLALLVDGSVWAWGANATGQLGDGSATGPASCGPSSCAEIPEPVSGVGGTGRLTGVSAISAGSSHVLALLSGGAVAAWGANGSGQLGDGITNGPGECGATPTACATSPVAVLNVGGTGQLTGVSAIAAGGAHSLALLAGGSVLAWGDNDDGQLGDGAGPAGGSVPPLSSTPVAVSGIGGSGTLSGVSAIAAGGAHSLALLPGSPPQNGIVVAWGDGVDGQLGDGSASSSAYPVQVTGLTNVVAIGATANDSYALEGNGTLWAWGDDSDGQLGDGSAPGAQTCGAAPAPCSTTPVQVGSGLGSVVALATGASSDSELAILGPQATVSPDVLSFPDQTLSTLSAPQTITITNTGASPLRVSSLTVVGEDPGDFAIDSWTCGAPLAPGSSCEAALSFVPEAAGNGSAFLLVEYNDLAGPALVDLQGNGVTIATGEAGVTGATGAAGSNGAHGVTGPPGAAGARGSNGTLQLTACTTVTVTVTRTIDGHPRKVKTKMTKCPSRTISGTLGPTRVSAAPVSASPRRSGSRRRGRKRGRR